MNYDNLNKVYNYWHNEILPNLKHVFNSVSFEEYLKRFAWLPSGKWIKDGEMVKINRTGFAIDPVKFTKKYKYNCVGYFTPLKPEDGVQRIIYQITPTLHVELALWIWVEHDILNSYGSTLICYHNEKEYFEFVNELYKIRRTGNTEEKQPRAGFLNLMDSGGLTSTSESV